MPRKFSCHNAPQAVHRFKNVGPFGKTASSSNVPSIHFLAVVQRSQPSITISRPGPNLGRQCVSESSP